MRFNALSVPDGDFNHRPEWLHTPRRAVTNRCNQREAGLRMLTLLEFVVRRQLKQNQELLVGLIENNPKKGIANPTTERLLKAFDDVTLTIMHLPDQIIRHVTPLTALPIRILELLGLSPGVYLKLSEN